MTTGEKAARVSGTGDDGGVAVIEATPLAAIAPAPTMVARPIRDGDMSGEEAPSKLSEVDAGDRGQCQRLGGKLPQ